MAADDDSAAMEEELEEDSGPHICAKCDKEIEDNIITFDEKPYHVACFACDKCGKEIDGSVYQIDGQLIDEDCYLEHYAKKCAVCGKHLTNPAEEKYVAVGELHYHADCLRCVDCNEPVSGKKFFNLKEENGQICEGCYEKRKQ